MRRVTRRVTRRGSCSTIHAAHPVPRQCSSRLSDSCMADLLGASIPERGAASTLQELLLRSQPLPRSPLRHCSSSSCSEAAAMAAADSLLTPLESCKNVVRSSWHQVVRRRQASSGQPGHHGLWCGQPPSGAASAASRRPLPRGKRNVFGGSDKDVTCKEITENKTKTQASGRHQLGTSWSRRPSYHVWQHH